MNILSKFLKAEGEKGKVTRDSLWNMIGLLVTSVFALLLMLGIIRFYDESVYGRYTIYYGIYICCSQFIGCGIHFSVMRHVVERPLKEQRNILVAAVVATIAAAVSLLLIMWNFLWLFEWFFDNPSDAGRVVLLMPGLLFFVINKVLLGFLSARREMGLYAVFWSSRAVLLFLAMIIFVLRAEEPDNIAVIFSFAEGVLFAGLLIVTGKYMRISSVRELTSWIKKHYKFGIKAVSGSVFIDINTRIDSLVLGIFVSDLWVGIYGFASMVADGFSQFAVVFRAVINPLITRDWKSSGDIAPLVRKWRKVLWMSMTPFGAVIVTVYPLVIDIVKPDSGYIKGWLALGLLIGSLALAMGYLPFILTLNQTGHPGTQSVLFFTIFLTNLVLNFIMIPLWGINGAAVATGIATVMTVLYIKLFVKRKLGVAI